MPEGVVNRELPTPLVYDWLVVENMRNMMGMQFADSVRSICIDIGSGIELVDRAIARPPVHHSVHQDWKKGLRMRRHEGD